MLLKWILWNSGWVVWIVFIWFKQGLVLPPCDHGNEPWHSLTGEKFLDYFSVLFINRSMEFIGLLAGWLVGFLNRMLPLYCCFILAFLI
jgi:hypothetical protein